MTDTQRPGKAPYQRIATEEGWASSGQLARYRKLVEEGKLDDPAFNAMWRFYLAGTSDRTRHIERCLADTDDVRLQHMDAAGIDFAILSLTSPGSQVFQREEAVSFTREANDELAAAVRRQPKRYAGLVHVAPQDPAEAAKEMQRGINELGFKGVIINSHTHGEYLSDEKFWPIFEAAESLDVPIYLHPNCPPKAMAMPFLEAGLDGAIFGFGVDTGLHALRMMTAGVFDRFPKLQLILGHMGEALPFWLYRLDYMHRATVRSGRYPNVKPLQRGIPELMRSNVLVTNSGVADPLAIKFSQAQLGVDRVLYAMDYPYQYEVSEVLTLDAMEMPAADKKAFFEDNARRVFKLD